MSRFFDGAAGATANDLISIGTMDDSVMAEDKPFSCVVWMKARSHGEGNFGRLVDRSHSTLGPFFTLATTRALRFGFFGGTNLVRQSNSEVYPLNAWVGVAMTWDGSVTATGVRFFVMGRETTYVTTTNGVGPSDNVADFFLIGNDSTAARTFDGWLAHVQAFAVELTDREVTQATFVPGSVRRGLRGFYTLKDGGNTKRILDHSGNGYHQQEGNNTESIPSNDNPPVQAVGITDACLWRASRYRSTGLPSLLPVSRQLWWDTVVAGIPGEDPIDFARRRPVEDWLIRSNRVEEARAGV